MREEVRAASDGVAAEYADAANSAAEKPFPKGRQRNSDPESINAGTSN